MAKSTRIPIVIENLEGDGYHIYIEVRVGKKKLKALIDTGASKTVLDRSLAAGIKKINLVDVELTQAKGLGEGMLDTSIARIPKLRIGRMTIEDHYVGLIDLAPIQETYRSLGLEPFDMILGGDILRTHEAIISYRKRWMKLFEKD